MKIVINQSASGFRLSEPAVTRIRSLDETACIALIERDNPILIQVVESLGYAANGQGASLKIVEIPDGTDWAIYETEGHEFVYDITKVWGIYGA